MKGPLLAEDGAKFTAVIQITPDGPQASFRVMLDYGSGTLFENDIRLFKSLDEAEVWLNQHAARRGFSKYPIERK